MSLPSFVEYMGLLSTLESIVEKEEYLEDVLEAMSASGIGVASVTTSDIGGVMLPIGTMARRNPINVEALMANKEAQSFLSKNIKRYRAIWKDAGDYVAQSVAEHLFLKTPVQD